MNKRKILISLVIVLLVAITAGIKLNQDFSKAAPLSVPDDIKSVTVWHEKSEAKNTDQEWISEITEILKNAEPTRRQSVNDSPAADDYYSVELTSESGEEESFYAYEDGKYSYIEFPYVGIYRVDKSLIDHIASLYPDYIYGKWVCCGVVEEGEELTESNIIGGQEMEEQFGADISGSEMVIGEKGIEGYSELPGSECGSLEQISPTEYVWELRINKLDGKDLDEPITELFRFTLNDGYLFVTLEYDTDEYDPGKPIVYKIA